MAQPADRLMRVGAAQSRDAQAVVFTCAGLHPDKHEAGGAHSEACVQI